MYVPSPSPEHGRVYVGVARHKVLVRRRAHPGRGRHRLRRQHILHTHTLVEVRPLVLGIVLNNMLFYSPCNYARISTWFTQPQCTLTKYKLWGQKKVTESH